SAEWYMSATPSWAASLHLSAGTSSSAANTLILMRPSVAFSTFSAKRVAATPRPGASFGQDVTILSSRTGLTTTGAAGSAGAAGGGGAGAGTSTILGSGVPRAA